MSSSKIAKIYSKVVFEMSKEKGVDVLKEMGQVVSSIDQSNELENVLFLDAFSINEKKEVLEDLLALLGTHKSVLDFIVFLVLEKRINLLPLIYKELAILSDHSEGLVRGEVSLPADLVGELGSEVDKLKDYLETKLQKKVLLNLKPSAEILSGGMVRVEDYQFEATFSGHSESMMKSILEDSSL